MLNLLLLAALASLDLYRIDTKPTEIVVDFDDDISASEFLSVAVKVVGTSALEINSRFSPEMLYLVDIRGKSVEEVESLLAKFRKSSHVEGAEWNQVYSVSGGQVFGRSDRSPDDPLWEKQWSFRMVDAPKAWEKGADGHGVTVAVIDTGVAFEEYETYLQVEDLAGTTFVKGYDFVDDDEHANDAHGHGTHVTGTIAQTTNNGRGVAGLAYKAAIMPLRVLNKQGFGTVADIADAVRFATDAGAQVINMSLGGGGHSGILEKAVAYARRKGVIVICAAGNSGQGVVEYPAAYKGAFAVSSVGPDKALAYYSSYGRQVAIAAPGGDTSKGGDDAAILQNTFPHEDPNCQSCYLAFQGTSMATPHVAAAAAMIISVGVTNPDKVEEILRDSAERATPAAKYGAGILNIGNAIDKAQGDTGGLSYYSMSVFMLLLMWGVRFYKTPIHKILWPATLPMLLSTAGIFSRPIPMWDSDVLGPTWHFTALWASTLPPLLVTVLLLSFKRLRGLLLGLALGWAAYLLCSAILMPSDVIFVPGTAGLLDRLWLCANAVGCLILAERICRKMVAGGK